MTTAGQLNAQKEPMAHVSMEKKLMFTIWLLSKQETFISVGDRFNIPISSGHIIFYFIVDILSKLMPQFVKWPTEALQATIAAIFEEKSRGILLEEL